MPFKKWNLRKFKNHPWMVYQQMFFATVIKDQYHHLQVFESEVSQGQDAGTQVNVLEVQDHQVRFGN